MTNFFEEAALAMMDPTSLAAQQSSSSSRSSMSSFSSFSSLSDLDVSSFDLRAPRSHGNPNESLHSVKPSSSFGMSPESFGDDHLAPDMKQDGLTTELYNMLSAYTSPSTDDCSPLVPSLPVGAALSACPPPSSSLPAMAMYSALSLQSTPYAHPTLSNKTSIESFASDSLLTPSNPINHPWHELAIPSGHQSQPPRPVLPGQSPVQPLSRSRTDTPRRDRAISLKSSIPSLNEEAESAGGLMPSQVMGTLPTCHQPPQVIPGEVFFFIPDPPVDAYEEQHHPPLLPAAKVSEMSTTGFAVKAPTFPSQSSFEQAASDYLVDGPSSWQGSDEQAFAAHSLPAGYQPVAPHHLMVSQYNYEARPLTAPGSSDGLWAMPPWTSTSMRKTRSNVEQSGRAVENGPSGLFTFEEREISHPQGRKAHPYAKGSRRVSRQRSPGELFATQPIDESRNTKNLSVKVLPYAKSNHIPSPAYFQPQGYHPRIVPPITPDEQSFPHHSHSTPLGPHRFPYGHTQDGMTPFGTFPAPPTLRRSYSSDSASVLRLAMMEGPQGQHQLSGWQPKPPQQQVMMTPCITPRRRVVSQQAPTRSVAMAHSNSISGWSQTVEEVQQPNGSLPSASAPPSNPTSITDSRLIAPLPLPKKRTASKSAPKARKASTKKDKAAPIGSFACSFINFTQDDAEKLLTGVAPSGSGKRRREVSGSAEYEASKRSKT